LGVHITSGSPSRSADAVYQHSGYARECGLPFEDHLGRIWVGGSNDVGCFDGARFYSMHDYGFPSGTGGAVAEDTAGGIWISNSSGIYRFFHGTLQEILQGWVQGLFVAGNVVVATIGPLQRINSTPVLVRIQQSGASWRTDRIAQLPFLEPFHG